MGVRQAGSVAEGVRRWVERLPDRAFFDSRDVPGSSRAVESALSRMAADGEIVRVRRGTYWKPPPARFGRRARPVPLEAGLHVGGRGAGPAGVSAARLFGLTTQVPAVEQVGVPGRAPERMRGVRFSSRPYSRREYDLNAYEVALLELLRAFDEVAERPWADLADAVDEAVRDGRIRPERVAVAVEEEHDRSAREGWRRLAEALPALASA
jgi:predicted transcriptional regulator of viral defense system